MPDPHSEIPRPRRNKPWVLTFVGLLAIGGLVGMPFLAGPPDEEKMPDLVRFFGHFHPVILHLPIGVFVLIMMQELGAIFGKRRHEHVANTAMFPLFFGAASAILAVIAGFLLYQGTDDYAGNALAERHLWGGLIFAVAAVMTYILKAWTVATAGNPAYYRLLLFGSVGIMSFASHDGASITHGEDYLIKYAPNLIRTLMGQERKKADTPVGIKADASVSAPKIQVVYADLIQPIFERRCVQCHKAGKAKGKFRMDTYELLVEGGKEGPGIELGKSGESNVVIRIELPEDDEEHMPPEGKPQLESHELMLVKWWIDNGADPIKSLQDFEVDDQIQAAISQLTPAGATLPKSASGSASTPEVGSEPPLPEASALGMDGDLKARVAELSKEFPGALNFESMESPLLTFTAASLRGNFDDAAFKKLETVTPQLVNVDLSATRITDAAVAQLAKCKNLRLIHLAETGITDVAIESLLKIPTLESINLYGTKVTDAGVSKLAAMSQLRRLYLWQTAVTPEAIKALQEKLPNCQIVTGIGL